MAGDFCRDVLSKKTPQATLPSTTHNDEVCPQAHRGLDDLRYGLPCHHVRLNPFGMHALEHSGEALLRRYVLLFYYQCHGICRDVVHIDHPCRL